MTEHGARTTTDEILDGLDLTGRRIVITGASSGLGEESARALAAHGAQVTMVARDQAKLDAAMARIGESAPEANLGSAICDLADLSSVRSFAEGWDAAEPIDVLMNNAGVMACPEMRTTDGFEMQFGTNHLGHFLLTALLWPALSAADAPRVVTLTSAGHTISDVDLDDPNFETTDYDPWISYGRAKTANALFARGLARRHGDAVLSFSVHPGGILTDLGRHLTDELLAEMNERTKARSDGPGFRFKKVEAGAATQVWASVDTDLGPHNGTYLADCQVGEPGGDPNTNGFAEYLLDDTTTDRLWTLSEELVGERFP